MGLGDLDTYGSNINLPYFRVLTWCTNKVPNDVILRGIQDVEGVTRVDTRVLRNQQVAQPSRATHSNGNLPIVPPPSSPMTQQPSLGEQRPCLMALENKVVDLINPPSLTLQQQQPIF